MDGNFVMTFITSIVSSATVTGLMVFILRTYIGEKVRASIQFEYDQKLEILKAEQESLNTKEIERLKAGLYIVATEREIKFRGLQEKQADVIANVYASIQIAYSSMLTYASSLRPGAVTDDKILDKMYDAFHRFKECFYPNVIYLPRNTAVQIERLLGRIMELQAKIQGDRRPGVTWDEPKMKTMMMRFLEVQNELPKQMRELEDEFRRILGNKISEKKPESEE